MPVPLFDAARELPQWLQGRHIADLPAHVREEGTDRLLHEAAEAQDPLQRQKALDEVVLLNGPIAEAIAARYRSRGIESDDLIQVAYLGLVKAARGYRIGEGPGFLAYAVPTISGEIKRHFRDFGWMIRPPRRIQELRSAAAATRADLLQEMGRPPTHHEVADALGVGVSELSEAVLSDGCFTTMSLDAPTSAQTATALADLLVDDSDTFSQVEAVESLRPALAGLSERDRQILLLRFIRGWTQEQIGQEIGVSQMQVSRLLNRILADLRHQLSHAED